MSSLYEPCRGVELAAWPNVGKTSETLRAMVKKKFGSGRASVELCSPNRSHEFVFVRSISELEATQESRTNCGVHCVDAVLTIMFLRDGSQQFVGRRTSFGQLVVKGPFMWGSQLRRDPPLQLTC